MAWSKPLISVIIPSYNHGEFVTQAIESVLTQTYKNLELIIIDDGSLDDSVQIISKAISTPLAKASGVKTHFFTQNNAGAHHTINLGLQKATGEYLTILNSDDYYYPQRIETLFTYVQKNRSELAFTLVNHVNEKGKPVASTHQMRSWYLKALKNNNYPSLGFHLLSCNLAVTTGNLFFSKTLYKKVGGFRGFQIMHDYDFILRSLYFTEPSLINKVLLAYRAHGNNTCIQLGHLAPEEGPRMAFDYFKSNLLRPPPENTKAPCKQYWKKEYTHFWTKDESWVKGWMGGIIPQEFL